MSDFAASWELSRSRFIDEIKGLSPDQLNWKIHPASLSIGEMGLHVAGVEVSFGSQLSGISLTPQGEKLKLAATESVVNDSPFPFRTGEITEAAVLEALEYSRGIVEPLIRGGDGEVRERQVQSVLGPVITGEGAFARLGFHAAYHQGQAYLIKTAPGFPQL